MNGLIKSKGKIRQPIRTLTIILALIGLTCTMSVTPAQAQDSDIGSLRKAEKTFVSVAKKVSPAVVFIKTEKVVKSQSQIEFFSPFGGNQYEDDFFKHFFDQPRQSQQRPLQEQRIVGQGSGFIISADGYILTNNHVVGDSDQITVTLLDGREFNAITIGTDSHSDVAVIKIDAKDLPVLTLGDSDDIEVGEWVIAVGNPFGLSHTLTAGIVSAKGRSSIGITDYEDFIQTDAAINPGNSGGPLVDLNGRAIGINTAIFSRSGGYMGIGFAIPINMAKVIQDQLIKQGSVIRGYLGIIIQNLTPDLAKTFGLKNQKGILVAQVMEDSAAGKARLKQGDVIIEFAGNPVKKVGEFRNRVSFTTPGTNERITIIRNGKRKDLTITIGKLPDSELVASASPHSMSKRGMSVKTLTRDLAEQFGFQGETGVLVIQVKPGSNAAMADIRPGVLIQEVNRKRINNTDEFEQVINQTPEHGTILLLIKDGQYSRYVTLKTE